MLSPRRCAGQAASAPITNAAPIISAAPGQEKVDRTKCPAPKCQMPSGAVETSLPLAASVIAAVTASAQIHALLAIRFAAIDRAVSAISASSRPISTPTIAYPPAINCGA